MISLFLSLILAAQPPPPPRKPTDDRRDASAKVSQAEALALPQTTRVNESKGLLTIMPKRFHEYRQEAATLNEAAKQQGQPLPIPDYATLRFKPLAKKVLQARIDAGKLTSPQEVK